MPASGRHFYLRLPISKRTFHLLIPPDISRATDIGSTFPLTLAVECVMTRSITGCLKQDSARERERMDSMSARFFARGAWVCPSTKTILQLLGTTATLLLISLSLFSQSNQGTIQGGVFDQTGGAIAGAA